MLQKLDDITWAHYLNETTVSADEVSQADLVSIRGFVPGGIYHPTHMRWFGSLEGITDPLQMIKSKTERKAMMANIEYFTSQGYEFKLLPLDEPLYHTFLEVYRTTTLNRPRALNIDTKDQLLSKIMIEQPVYLVGMFKDSTLISGLTFYLNRRKEASVALGAKERFDSIRGGVGGVLEYFLTKFCLELGVPEIIHGKTLNPAGITGSAGIFSFKARYGYDAYPEGYWITTFVKNPAVSLSDLVFVTETTTGPQYQVFTASETQANQYGSKYCQNISVTDFSKLKEHSLEALDLIIKGK